MIEWETRKISITHWRSLSQPGHALYFGPSWSSTWTSWLLVAWSRFPPSFPGWRRPHTAWQVLLECRFDEAIGTCTFLHVEVRIRETLSIGQERTSATWCPIILMHYSNESSKASLGQSHADKISYFSFQASDIFCWSTLPTIRITHKPEASSDQHMEASIAKRPFEHTLWPEVCKSR